MRRLDQVMPDLMGFHETVTILGGLLSRAACSGNVSGLSPHQLMFRMLAQGRTAVPSSGGRTARRADWGGYVSPCVAQCTEGLPAESLVKPDRFRSVACEALPVSRSPWVGQFLWGIKYLIAAETMMEKH